MMSEDFGNHGDDEVDEEEKAMENFDHDPSMELPPENLKKYFVNIPIPGPRCRQCKRRIKSRPWIERADFCGPKCQREHLKMLHIMENERRRGQSQERRQELERQWQKRRQELEAKLHDADERVADILKELEQEGYRKKTEKDSAKTKAIIVRVPVEVFRAMMLQAHTERRSINIICEGLIRRYLGLEEGKIEN